MSWPARLLIAAMWAAALLSVVRVAGSLGRARLCVAGGELTPMPRRETHAEAGM